METYTFEDDHQFDSLYDYDSDIDMDADYREEQLIDIVIGEYSKFDQCDYDHINFKTMLYGLNFIKVKFPFGGFSNIQEIIDVVAFDDGIYGAHQTYIAMLNREYEVECDSNCAGCSGYGSPNDCYRNHNFFKQIKKVLEPTDRFYSPLLPSIYVENLYQAMREAHSIMEDDFDIYEAISPLLNTVLEMEKI